jgi:hypothetical protein
MSYDSRNDDSFTTAYNFSGFHNPSTTSEQDSAQIFRKIGFALSAAEVLRLYDTVKTLPREEILQLIKHHCYDCKEEESKAKEDQS